MKLRISVFVFFIISFCFLLIIPAFASDQPLETVSYNISPLGTAEYQDFGEINFQRRKVNLVIFKTDAPGFHDTEKIYSDPKTELPLLVERDISFLFDKEYLVEQYFAKENRLLITKFVHGKKTQDYLFQADAPIQNAVVIPFILRKFSNLAVGWSCDVRLPDKFKVKLVGIEDVVVPAGKYKAYHFTSTPHKFEIWISTDSLRLPIKIKGIGGLSYTLVMKGHILNKR